MIVEKTVIFYEEEKELISKIEVFQKQKEIGFQEAVKELCKLALEKNNLEWGEF